MQFGIYIPQRFSTEHYDHAHLKQFLSMAEAKGYDSAWVMERVVGNPPVLEPLALLSYVAACTSKIKLGSAILMPVMRNPVILAKSLSSIDHLSSGRLIVGLAFGGFTQSPYYPAFGVSPKSAGSRFEEGINIMTKVWTEDKTTYHGRYWQLDDMQVTPKPYQKPHPPLWFGAHSPAALKRSVRLGVGWSGSAMVSTKTFSEELGLLNQYLVEEGRDPGTFTISKGVYMAVDRNKEQAEGKLRDHFSQMYGSPELALESSVYGSPEDCLEGLSKLADLNVGLVMTNLIYDEMDQVQRLAEEVFPKLR